MRPVSMLVLACVGFAVAPIASAETLRCGSVLIEPGDDATYVLEKCGEPAAALAMPVVVPGMYGNVYQTGVLRADRWLYHRKPGQFPAVVTIGEDGRVQNIEFERIRD